MYIRFHVKYPLFLSYFNKFEFSRQILEKKLKYQFSSRPV
jgi:hypothetical protein